MARRLIDTTEIGDAMRDIQKREGRDGVRQLDDSEATYSIEMVPIDMAERRVVGVVKIMIGEIAYIRPGQICVHCKGDRTCRCYGEAFPTHWGRLPDQWKISVR